MIFNSITFLAFFISVFIIYYFPLKKNTKAQNWLLLLSSYFFYGFANWRIIPILLVATIIIFFLGRTINKTNNEKKSSLLTTLGVLTCVGLLVYFKYFNFFIESFSSLFNSIGLKTNIGTFNIIMPLGISFFTFKLISYIIEIQRGKIEHCNDFIIFSTYISFFPTILSGPIDRPNAFIPQLQKKRLFDYTLVIDACRQILWGLFLKAVIADNLAIVVDDAWGDIPNQSGIFLFNAIFLYSIQLYTDFSGYSHMAIGVGKFFGFHVIKNFNYPYFSRNVAEFWRNWHMSLTSWLTDYVFMPLNIKFRNLGDLGIILAITINMIIVGIWHGPKWTFVLFGLYNGLLYIPLILSGSFFKNKKLKTNKYDLPKIRDLLKIGGTFTILSIGFVIFKAEDLNQAYKFYQGIFDLSFDEIPKVYARATVPIILSVLLFVVEWFARGTEFPLSSLEKKISKPFIRWSIYSFLIFVIGMYMVTEGSPFIYFQF